MAQVPPPASPGASDSKESTLFSHPRGQRQAPRENPPSRPRPARNSPPGGAQAAGHVWAHGGRGRGLRLHAGATLSAPPPPRAEAPRDGRTLTGRHVSDVRSGPPGTPPPDRRPVAATVRSVSSTHTHPRPESRSFGRRLYPVTCGALRCFHSFCSDFVTGRSVVGSWNIPALRHPGPGHSERREGGGRLLQAALNTGPRSSQSRPEAEGLVPLWPSSPSRQVKPQVCVPGRGTGYPMAPSPPAPRPSSGAGISLPP